MSGLLTDEMIVSELQISGVLQGSNEERREGIWKQRSRIKRVDVQVNRSLLIALVNK